MTMTQTAAWLFAGREEPVSPSVQRKIKDAMKDPKQNIYNASPQNRLQPRPGYLVSI